MADMGNIHKEIIIPNRIYLQGIQPETTEEELESKFRKYGSIIETRIIRDRITGEKKDYAFITFDSQQVAENVKATCKSIELHGTEIIVGTAKIQRRPKFFNRYHNSSTSPHHHQGPPVPPPQPPQQPRLVSVPCTVSPDGLYTFHQQLLPICFPVEPGVPIDEEEYNQGLSPIPEEYSNSPEPAAPVASKPGPSLLPLIENSKHHFQPIEAPNNNSSLKKGAPVTVTASDYTSPTFAPSDIHRKLHPISAGFQMGPNHLPIISNNHLEAANVASSGEVKSGIAANNMHMPNGNLPTSFSNLPTSFGSHHGNHHPMNIADVSFLNGNMAYHYFPVATLMPPPNEWPPISPPHATAVSQVEQANFIKPEPRKPNINLPTSSSPMPNNRGNMPNRVTFAGNKVNGEHCGTAIKNQPYLFMSTTHTKMNRVMTVQ